MKCTTINHDERKTIVSIFGALLSMKDDKLNNFLGSITIDKMTDLYIRLSREFYGRDERTGIEYGINIDGDLYLGNDSSGYNLRDTPENRKRVLADFKRYTSSSY